MPDILPLLTAAALNPAEAPCLQSEIAAHAAALRSSAGRGDPAQVARAEEAVRANPAAAFGFDAAGAARLTTPAGAWHAGRFETVSLRQLKDRLRPSAKAGARVRLWVFAGASPVTDIGALQATSDALFQVASQFNCLEAPGPTIARVAHYFSDPTQGPRASISEFPATLLRHYAAPGPDGARFVQQEDGPQVDLLGDALGPGAVCNGYFTGAGPALLAALDANFDAIRVGVHDDAQVVLGYDWEGAVEGERRIAQVFTSTVAGGYYGGHAALGPAFPDVCLLLLRAAYLGTVLAAASLGKGRVVLTLIGGGVFGNAIPLIWEAIQWACAEAEPYLCDDLEVFVNGYNIGSQLDLDAIVLPAVRDRDAAVLLFDSSGLAAIKR